MGSRRIEALVLGLPPDSAVARSNDEATAAGWGVTEELLTLIAELIDLQIRNFLAANGVKKGKMPQPLRIQRPWQEKKAKPKATKDDLRSIFAGAIVPPKKES